MQQLRNASKSLIFAVHIASEAIISVLHFEFSRQKYKDDKDHFYWFWHENWNETFCFNFKHREFMRLEKNWWLVEIRCFFKFRKIAAEQQEGVGEEVSLSFSRGLKPLKSYLLERSTEYSKEQKQKG